MSFDFKERIYSRFERFVRVDTRSDEKAESCPSTPGQLELGRIAAQEMKAIGLRNVTVDANGYVTGELPATPGVTAPAIGFLAHLDTSPDCSGANVIPGRHNNYQGGDIIISEAAGLTLSAGAHGLSGCKGHDIITASGGTLLGADNKAGMAIILAAFEYLAQNPSIRHGLLKAAFTPDEEIGRGADLFDVAGFGAEFAYTVDGDIEGTVEDETFNADSASVSVTGRSYHPGSSKNLMYNAGRIAADIVASWPEHMLPETTEDREGFIMFTDIRGDVEKAELSAIVRDHDLKKLQEKEALLEAIVAEKRLKYPGAEIKLVFKQSYRNMKEVIARTPQVMEKLLAALAAEGVTPIHKPVRGGTDGARLSFMGLPTPNLFTGGSNFHGPYEWVSLDSMVKSAQVVARLAQEWASPPAF
ncbi:MAG: peptidase T [Elusimicrobiaceae bacterium]|nr:peptidase T [Elusimicrobiaceae bacterium]